MKKLTRLFVASLCMAALTSCGEQRKQVVYEEQGPFEVFTTQNTEVVAQRIISSLTEYIACTAIARVKRSPQDLVS